MKRKNGIAPSIQSSSLKGEWQLKNYLGNPEKVLELFNPMKK